MRVCITNPCWDGNGKSGIRSGSRVPNIIGGAEHTFIPFPFPLAYAASTLEAAGCSVLLIDAIAEQISTEEYYARINTFRPDLIINEISTASYRHDLNIVGELRRRENSVIAVCGPHPSALPAETLHDCAELDAVFIGEIEKTASEFASKCLERKSWKDIPGIAFRTSDGEISVNVRRALITDIDTLPYPKRDGLPLSRYRVAGFMPTTLFMYASRGCPYHCTFCLWPQTMYGAGEYRARKPEAVVGEIRQAWENYGPFGSIYFDDDTFNIGRERMFTFAEAMRTLPFKVPWGCNARAELFDAEIMNALAGAGMFSVRIGIESGDPEILRRSKKNLDLNAVRRCIDLAHNAGVAVHASYTIGLSGESRESIERTIAFARSISPDSVAFTVTTPYPGTAYYNEISQKGFLESREWDRYNGIDDAVFHTESLSSADIVNAECHVMKKVYYTPTYVLRRFRYAANINEMITLARKGLKLFLKR